MRASSIKYLIKEGFKNIWSNKLMSVASIGVLLSCLLITGSAVLFSVNVKSAMKKIEDQNSFTVYLDKDVSSLEAVQIGEKIKKISNVSSCAFFSKEDAINKYKETLGSLFEGLQGENNPMPDAYRVSMYDLSVYEETINQIASIDGVDTVGDRSKAAESLVRLDKLITSIGFWIVLILGAVSLFIVSNTISVTMYSRRLEISMMKSVGATDGFIRIPFVVEGIVIGLISATIALACLGALYETCMKMINQIIPFLHIEFTSMILPVAVSFIAAGILFGLIGGLISISKYLKKGGGDIIGL